MVTAATTYDEKLEKELLVKAQKGKKEAFEPIIQHYQMEIYNYILKMIRDSYLAMDILQETMLKAWRYLDKYNFQYPFKVLLYKIAKSAVIDETRKKAYKSQKQSISMYTPGVQMPSAQEPDQLEYASLKEALAAALDKLPDNLKSIVVLCDIEELSYEEAAKIENTCVGTVKSRLNRARTLLKKNKQLKEFLY